MKLFSSSMFVALAGWTLTMLSACALTSSRANSIEVSLDDVPTVTYCQLTKSPDSFHEKVVRVSGVFEKGFEKSYFYDPKCENTPARMWVSYHKSFVLDGDTEEARKNRMISGFGRWSVTVVGRFVRAKEPGRFGHLGCCRYELGLIRIEESEKLPDN